MSWRHLGKQEIIAGNETYIALRNLYPQINDRLSQNIPCLNLLAKYIVTKIGSVKDLIDFQAMQGRYLLMLIEIRMVNMVKYNSIMFMVTSYIYTFEKNTGSKKKIFDSSKKKYFFIIFLLSIFGQNIIF